MRTGGFAVWKVLLFVMVAGLGLWASQKPWRAWASQRKDLARVEARMREAESERARLTREKTRFESPLSREAAIRENGYHRANEKPVDLD